MKPESIRKIIWMFFLSAAFAIVESAVVVYLRKIYYPNGFQFPLCLIDSKMLKVEIVREFATLVMLISMGALAGRRLWERFGYFILSFGIWDIFYYVWLKSFLGWPTSFKTWDILFLIPLPWIGPVLAPVLISLLMIFSGIMIIDLYDRNYGFQPGSRAWILSILGSSAILYSFMRDTEATLHQQMPRSYGYGYLVLGIFLFIGAIASSYRRSIKRKY
jgi:hypothetical protein